MKYTILLLSLLFVCNLSAQEYKTYKKINDSTFVETRNLEKQDSVKLTKDAALAEFFQELNRWEGIMNRHYENYLKARAVFGALNRDQLTLIADTTYNWEDKAEQEILQWIPNEKVAVGDIRKYKKELYECVQAHTTLPRWSPDKTPALWKSYSTEECPEWVQPTGAQDAYKLDDCVTYQGQEYVSTIDANVWAPDVTGWQLKQ